MKCALVLTGLLRGWDKAYPAFKSYFLDRYHTDVFINIYDEVGWYSGKSYQQAPTDQFVKLAEGDKGFHTSGELVDVKPLIEAYSPITLRIEKFATLEPLFEKRAQNTPQGYTRPKNTIGQAYMAFRGMQLVSEQPMDYDLVVRARPDILLENDPGQLSPKFFYTLPSKNKNGQGTGDSIQIGSFLNVARFADMWLHIEELYKECGNVSCPHLYAYRMIQRVLPLDDQKASWVQMMIGAQVKHSPSGVPYAEPEAVK